MAAEVKIVVRIDDRGVVTGFNQIDQAGQKLGSSLERAGRKGNVVMTQMRNQTHQARDAVSLLGNQFGIELPRELEKFLSKSKLIAPALAGAFNAAVVLGFAHAASAAGHKVAELAADVLGYTRAIREMQEVQVPANKKIVELTEKLRDLDKQLKLTGLEGVARFAQELKFAGADTSQAGDKVAQLGKKLEDLKRKSEETATVILARPAGAIERLTENAKKAKEEIPGVEAALSIARKESTAAGKSFELAGKNLGEAFGKQRVADMVAISDQIERMRDSTNKWIEKQKELLKEKQEIFGKLMGPFVPEEVQIAGVPTPEEHARRQAGLEALQQLNDEWLRHTGRTVEQVNQEYERDLENFKLLSLTKKITEEEFAQASTRLEEMRTSRLQEFYKQQAEEHRRAVAQMADELGRFIDDPIRYIKEQWKRMLLTMVAEWILSMRGMKGPGGAGAGGGLGGIFGGIFGGGGVFGLPGTTPPTFPGPASFGSSFLSGLGFGTGLSAGQGFGMGFVPPGQQRGGSQQQRGLLDRLFSRGFQSESNPGLGAALGMAGIGLGVLGFTRGSPLIGAAGGALAGFQIGGPIGAVIGSIVGLFAGIFGRGRKRKQRDDLERQAFAAIKLVEDSYNVGQMDYLSARAQFEQIRQQVDAGMKQLGWPSRMNPHIDSAINRINATEQERQRRDGLTVSPRIFHGGGYVSPAMAAIAPAAGPGPGGLRAPKFPSWMKYHAGGDVPAILKAGEYVVDDKTVRRKGGPRGVEMALAGGGAGSGITVNIYPQSLDRAWLRNGGAEEIAREIRRAVREGA